MDISTKLAKLPPYIKIKEKGDVPDYAELHIRKFYHRKGTKSTWWAISYKFGNNKEYIGETGDDLDEVLTRVLIQVNL